MFLDMAWSEIALIGAVALVAIGPKDLPKAMLLLGRGVRQARHFASHVHQQFEQATYEAERAEAVAMAAAQRQAKAQETSAKPVDTAPITPVSDTATAKNSGQSAPSTTAS